MLSDGDRRRLHDIESDLRTNDPRLAARMASLQRTQRHQRWARRGCDTVIGLSLATTALCMLLAALGAPGSLIGTATVTAILALAALDIRLRRFPPPN